MVRVLFLCHGNICRSPMAEFVMRELVRQAGASGWIVAASAAVSREEIGDDIHRGARRKLTEMGIPFEKRAARQVTRADMDSFDYVLLMEAYNKIRLSAIVGEKAEKAQMLLSFAGEERDIADPWYTGDFDKAYDDILCGCTALLKTILEKGT